MHAVAVELYFVEPLIAFRRRVDELGELWWDPCRQSARGAAPAGYQSRHGGSGQGVATPKHGLYYASASSGGP